MAQSGLALAGSKTTWWKRDPFLNGDGLGVQLHEEKRHRWRIVRVLTGSPAERAGLRPGDLFGDVDGYSLGKGHLEELLLLVRASKSRRHVVTVTRAKEGTVRVTLTASAIRPLVGGDEVLSSGDGGGCKSCYHCWPSSNGWSSCGRRGCRTRCAIV